MTDRQTQLRAACNRELVRLASRQHAPRTLAEAFPQHEAWRGVIEHHKRPLSERIADVIFATVLGICGAALLVHFLVR